MLDYDYFYAINNGPSIVKVDDKIDSGRQRLTEALKESVHYDGEATVNGKKQGIIITSSENYYKAKVEALPGERIHTGDIVYSRGEHWIVRNVRSSSPFQITGLAWQCNLKFRWQNNSPKIIERWGVLDSGVYSSTRDGDATAMTADKQYKILLSYDNDTAQLNIDKRLAVGFMYNKEHRKVLNVQKITGYDPVSTSYGQNGHLLVLNVRSDDYIEAADSVKHMICDYIPQQTKAEVQQRKGKMKITGAETIRPGCRRVFEASFEVDTWDVTEIEGLSYEPLADSLILMLDWNEDSLGEIITITATDENGLTATWNVEVVS